MKKVCIIGGGAAGLMAAYASSRRGNEVTLIEKNEKLGKKIYITGKGRCNFTNDTSVEEFLQNVVRGAKFLTGSLYAFPPQKVIEFFENQGLSVKTERGNRVFPASDHASDVTKTLEKACKEQGVQIRLKEEVQEILTSSISDIIITPDITMQDIIPMPRIVAVKTDKGIYECDVAIVATGGVSYPSTGSTGDGYTFASRFGHEVVDVKCGLCGLNLEGDFYKDLQGLSLKNVVLTAKYGKKTLYKELGEMLFTHFGVSGPLVLSLSSLINRLPLKEVELFLDLKPALDEQVLDKRLLRDFEKYKNKRLENALVELLPFKLIAAVLSACGVKEDKIVHSVTKEERLRLLKVLKAFPMRAHSLRGFNEAIITSGGVALKEINPKTMESKRVQGLKFCGEVLDIDAFTGGFNMQIAFSTGFAAGDSVK